MKYLPPDRKIIHLPVSSGFLATPEKVTGPKTQTIFRKKTENEITKVKTPLPLLQFWRFAPWEGGGPLSPSCVVNAGVFVFTPEHVATNTHNTLFSQAVQTNFV